MKSADPSTPVKVLGFSGLPNAGDELVVMESERSAKALALERQTSLRMSKLAQPQRATLENLFASLADEQKKHQREMQSLLDSKKRFEPVAGRTDP